MKPTSSGNWIFLCNPNYYLIDKAFRENETLYWHQIKRLNRIQIGATVYVYLSGKEGIIRYKTTVVDKDIETPLKDDSCYSLKQEKLDDINKQKRYLLLKLEQVIKNEELNLNFLKQNGVTCFMGPISLSVELNSKINKKLIGE